MALLNIHTFPDPILKEKALPVVEFDQSLDDITQSMLETMYVSSGIGLAAIQVGILKQIIVIDLKSGEQDISLREPHVFVNPKILKKFGSTVSEEGCLSVIDFRGDIERAEKILVEYQDVKGNIHQIKADEMMSICLQHEIDHLNGILFIDHLPVLKQKMVKKKLTKLAMENARICRRLYIFLLMFFSVLYNRSFIASLSLRKLIIITPLLQLPQEKKFPLRSLTRSKKEALDWGSVPL